MFEEKSFKYEVKPGFIGRLLGKKTRMVQLGHDVLPFERITENEHHYVDKAWHVLHYLMTGGSDETNQSLGFFLSGGQLVGEWRRGYDAPPRVFLAAETRMIAIEIDRLTEDVLLARFDWPEMMRQKIYPEIALQEKVPPDLWAGYCEQYQYLKEFLLKTAELNQGFAVSYG